MRVAVESALAVDACLDPTPSVSGNMTACDRRDEVLLRLSVRSVCRGATVVAVRFGEPGDNPHLGPLGRANGQ